MKQKGTGMSNPAAIGDKIPLAAAAAANEPTKKGGIFSVSCGASCLMALYLTSAAVNMYYLMFPLAPIDLSQFKYPNDFVHPLWKKDAPDAKTYMRVYLSTESFFNLAFLQADKYDDDADKEEKPTLGAPHVLLWDERVDSPSLSKSFLLTTLQEECSAEGTCDGASADASYKYAVDWLDHAEHIAKAERDGDGGIFSSLSAASGHGIESTSFLLTFYESLAKQFRHMLKLVGMIDKDDADDEDPSDILDRTTVRLDPASPIWSSLQSNHTLHVQVLILRAGKDSMPPTLWPPTSKANAEKALRLASMKNSLLVGHVGMIKYDAPSHIENPRRLLYKDLIYLWNKYVRNSREMPPWVFAISKPEEYEAYQTALSMKEKGMGYPYWKPEVSVKYVSDEESYPVTMVHAPGMPVAKVQKSAEHPQGMAFLPALHVDEMGMTSEKYVPINQTVTTLPLRITFDRNDMEHKHHATTATAGGISPARWRLLQHLGESIDKQKDLGFDQSDIDDMKRMIADTNITLLSITLLASSLHAQSEK